MKTPATHPDKLDKAVFSFKPAAFYFYGKWNVGEQWQKESIQTADAGNVSSLLLSTPTISRLPASSMVPLIKLQKLSVTGGIAVL